MLYIARLFSSYISSSSCSIVVCKTCQHCAVLSSGKRLLLRFKKGELGDEQVGGRHGAALAAAGTDAPAQGPEVLAGHAQTACGFGVEHVPRIDARMEEQEPGACAMHGAQVHTAPDTRGSHSPEDSRPSPVRSSQWAGKKAPAQPHTGEEGKHQEGYHTPMAQGDTKVGFAFPCGTGCWRVLDRYGGMGRSSHTHGGVGGPVRCLELCK